MTNTTTKNTTSTIILILSAIVGLILLINVGLLISANSTLTKKAIEAAELSIPAKIQLVTLTAPSCVDCYNISLITKQLSVANITSNTILNFDSTEAKTYIEKYNITRIPSIIVTGETTKNAQIHQMLLKIGTEFGKEHQATIIRSPIPPFIDPRTKQIKGQVSLQVLTKSDCTECFDISPLVKQLQGTLTVKSFVELDIDSKEGRALQTKYHIEALPTIVFDNEAAVYPTISDVWPLVGSIESDGSYVMRNVNPPFYNITSSNVEGLIDLTILTDISCPTCYDAEKINKAILAQMGIIPQNVKKVDINSPTGKQFLNEYNITLVPTIILQGDMNRYPSLTQSWRSVGSVEQDGAYVLRKIDIFEQPYKNIVEDKVITPKSSSKAPPPSTSQVGTPSSTTTKVSQ